MPATRRREAVASSEVHATFLDRPEGERPHADARDAAPKPARHRTGRRRFVDPTASEAEATAAVAEFQRALENDKRRSGRLFPTWSEVLEVLQGLGYEKIAGGPCAPGSRSEGAGNR